MALQPRGAGNYALVAEFPVTRNAWTHVVMTWDTVAGGGLLYAEGKLLKQGLYDLPFVPTAQKMRIGQGLIGFVDEVKLYKRALTPSEATALR